MDSNGAQPAEHCIEVMVSRIEPGQIWVRPRPVSACSRCAGQGCSSVSIARLFCQPQREFRVQADRPLAIGEWVTVAVSEGRVLSSALLAYGLPVLGLLLGAAFGTFWPVGQSEFSAVLGGVLGLLCGFAMLFGVERFAGNPESRLPRVIDPSV